MATVQSKGTMFDPKLVSDLVSKVQGHSTLAKLSSDIPLSFNGNKEFTFAMDKEIDIVAENGKKSSGGITVEPVTIVPIKFEYGARISDEFLYASEEEQIDILSAFNDGFAKKVARGLDIAAFHGTNPRTQTASAVIGTNCIDKKVTNAVTYSAANIDDNIEAAIALVEGGGYDVTGLALGTDARGALAALKDGNGGRLYPELAWGGNPGTVNGLATDVNTTVFGGIDRSNYAYVGDFANMFKWGYAKEVPLEVIEYGDPDGSGNDLKAYNQVYLRAEVYLGWAVFDAKAFARIDGLAI